MRVLDLDMLKDDPHVVALGMVDVAEHPSEGVYRQVRSPLGFAAAPYTLCRRAPRLGEHTAEVLLEAGLSQTEVDRLAAAEAGRG
jgi:crotonobetainyl-CoA:carnitine CoA-transferase CaiB-like acyl-CoA transferase